MAQISIPKTQTAAIVAKQGGPLEFDDNYPVTLPGDDEILVKVLYTGVCQSGKSTLSSSPYYMHHSIDQVCVKSIY